MKRAMPWSDEEDSSSSKESSLSQSDSDDSGDTKASFRVKAGRSSKEKDTEVKSGKRKVIAVNFDTLKRHGYKGGPSVLKVPAPKENEKQDWSWATGREKPRENGETEESYEERQKTRAALQNGEQLLTVLTRKEKEKEKEKEREREREKKNISFSQKEKRKRELGQASRGKNYVEEEKRTLRESGIYSGFDT